MPDESISPAEAVANWVADGTPTQEPVTTETPAPEPVREPESQPSAESSPPAPAQEPAVAPEMFVGRVGEQEFKVPVNFEIPLKRGDEIEWVPVGEAQKRGMLEKDYRAKTTDLSTQRQQLERQVAEANAIAQRHAARERLLAERERRIQEMVRDPEGLEQYNEHLEQYRNNPIYRKAIDDSLDAELLKADTQVSQELQYAEAVDAAAAQAVTWIDEIGQRPEFAGVDKSRVRETYARELQQQSARFDPTEVERIFRSEAKYRQQVLEDSPLRRELEELKAQVAAQKAQQQASVHNQTVQNAIARARTPNVAPAGAPSAPAPKPNASPIFGRDQLEDRISAWNRGQ